MLRLTWRGATSIPVEAPCLTPEQLAGWSPNEISQLPVQHGNRRVALGDFFGVAGDAADEEVRIEGDCRLVKGIGSRMQRGRLYLDGSAGMHLGAEMQGGDITVAGDAGDWLGAEMRGGHIHVYGNAGHHVGASYPGSARGMRGGTILIDGSAGDDLGSRMRRGLIAVRRRAGEFVGASMIAGTILAFGGAGALCGAGMKRGTIALFAEAGPPLPTFRYECLYQPVFMRLYLRQLVQQGISVPSECFRGAFARFRGDLVALGKGEVLYWRGPSGAK